MEIDIREDGEMKNGIMAAIAALGLSATNLSAEESRAAWIAVDQDSESVASQIFAALEAGETGTYKLVSRKSGRSGSAVSKQAGRIGLSDGNAKPYSTSRFSLRSGEALEAELTVTTSSGRTFVDKVKAVAE